MARSENGGIMEVRSIPIDQLVIGPSQARVHDVSKDIAELADSIRVMGLLEPITVRKVADSKYEIIAGQRRFLAHQMLGRNEVMCSVLPYDITPEKAKAISLTENMLRRDMTQQDYIAACTDLYRFYGSLKLVSEQLGLPLNRVREYVKFDQLVDELKQVVRDGGMRMDVALRAQKAATSPDGSIDEEKAIALAREMSGLSGIQQKRLAKVAEADPAASIEEVIETGRRQPRVKQIILTIGDDVDVALSRFAAEQGVNKDDAAVDLIESALSQRGYAGTL
jgi:ParB family transcriptional regulator, chromosome partitioning protein